MPHSDFVCSEVVDLNDNPCENSDLEVIIGVDPGNVLVAIVNGDSVDYNFYWSTGEINTGLISDSIVAPEDGNYYVIVEDDNGCVAFASTNISSETVDAQFLLAKWYLVGETENDVSTFDVNACNITVQFTETQLIATEFYGDSCEFSDEIISNYELNGNIITETAEGDTSIITILELTPFKMVLQEIDGDFTYVETYSNIFGDWTITATECGGPDIDYTGSITLNSDYTVTQEDDSGGNYIINYFSFENYELFIKTEYMDPVCDGTDSRFQSDTVILNYDSITDSFSGTGNTVKDEIDVTGCQLPPYNCNYNVVLSR